MKLLSVNIEGQRHLDRIRTLIANANPDTICLQEVPDFFVEELAKSGWNTSFAPMLIRERDDFSYVEGVAIVSKHLLTTAADYYYKSADTIVVQKMRDHTTCAHPVLFAMISISGGETYHVATTHCIVTMDGRPDEHQRIGVEKMLSILSSKPPHVLCGDFNIPRGHNELYDTICQTYTDRIPHSYSSSLDKNLHMLGPKADMLSEPIFEEYMVDYIFTQQPYTATGVTLQFRVSDHAAILATISKECSY